MIDNFSKVYVSVEDLAVRRMHVDPERLLFMFDERILIFLKSDIFYLPSVKTPTMAANPLKKMETRRYMTEVSTILPALRFGRCANGILPNGRIMIMWSKLVPSLGS